MNSGADLADVLEVDALHSEDILFLLFLAHGDSCGGLDYLVDLEAKEVFDLDCLRDEGDTLPLSMSLATMGKWE